MFAVIAGPWLLEAAQASSPHVPHRDGFLPHGFCYLWNRPLLWTHLTSDLLIGLSYVVISFALATLVHRARRDIPFSVIFVAFGLFIIACGMTHFMEVWTLWQPVYWLSGYVKVVTALASVSTAAVMPFMIPRVHATIRDAKLSRERELAATRVAALEEANEQLQQQAIELEQQREEAEALAEELEQANAELRAALTAVEQANRAKGDFLAVMSHELRTPLNAIGGYVELLALGIRGAVTDEQRADLGRIRRSQQHLLSIINDILNFNRLGAGAVAYELTDVPLHEVLAGVEHLVAPLVQAQSLEYRYAPCGADVAVRADPEKLRQILLNLLSNAIKFTPPGGHIALGCATAPGVARVHVRDTGLGIPADKLEAVFEPFVQLGRSLTRPVEGTGLGLSISRALARGMGGDLTVSSAPGEGAVFTLSLPLTVLGPVPRA